MARLDFRQVYCTNGGHDAFLQRSFPLLYSCWPANYLKVPLFRSFKMELLRVLSSGPGAGAWNMACDETLLDLAALHGQSFLRFYTWSEPTVSLGYFQAIADRFSHCESAKCSITRRMSGGGAIVHDRELTYCLVLPSHHPLASKPSSVYWAVHDALVRVLADWRFDCSIAGNDGEEILSPPPFLCFLRRGPGDVISSSTKIAGSAQRSRRGAVLQHGSVLLARSEWAPEIPGVLEIGGNNIKPCDLIEPWKDRMAAKLGLPAEEAELSREAQERSTILLNQKYANRQWIEKR